MPYTLTRFRHLGPSLPCRLGGIFVREGERCSLRDATGLLELEGEFSECRDGDWITLQVLKFNGTRITCEQVELVQRPEGGGVVPDAKIALAFSEFVREVRAFFLNQGLIEIHTPTLVRCPGLEPSLEAFATTVTRGRETVTAYLPTSPEVHLKKALALGHTDIFEIKSCFRRGEFSEHHENEFFMLEWYRAFADLKLIAEDLQKLLDYLSLKREAKPFIRETTWAELFFARLNFELKPQTSRAELSALCKSLNVHQIESDSFNDLFHRLVIDKIEPGFKSMGPLLMRGFPPSQAALAKLTEDGWADRFEFYWNGLEIANAFNEVNDPDEQRRRWQAEQDERKHLGTADMPVDDELIALMRERGFPPTGGIALGVERLFMAFHGVNEIRGLRLFGTDQLFKNNADN